MGMYEIFSISPEDYNTALFEAGCIAAEKQYSTKEATLIKNNRSYWHWLKTQQDIVDMNFWKCLEREELKRGSKQAFDAYYKMLCDHLESVYFPERFKNELLKKEVQNG